MQVADQSVSRSILTIAIELVISSKDFFGKSLLLLYRVVPCPLMPSMVISEAIMPYNPLSIYPCYLLFTPDGTRILHGSEFGAIWVWDLSLWELIKIQMEWHDLQVGDWVCLLNNQIIVSGASNGSYNFWDVISGTPIRFCTASQGSKGLEFMHLASAPNDLTAQRWEMIHNQVAYISEESIFVDEKSSNTHIASLNVGGRHPEDFMLSPSGQFISLWLPHSNNSYLWNINIQTVYRLEYPLDRL